MAVSDFSIKNPVFPVMLCSAMIVFGYLGYRELGISQFPEIDFPVVSITTTREAASPDIVDGDVTDVIEDAISGIEGIDYIISQSVQGTSIVTVNFQLYRDVDAAMRDVQNAVSAAMNRLPTDIDPPTISKVNMNKFPVMWLGVHGTRPLSEINAFVDDHLKQAVETIPGCGGLMYGGLRQRNMRIWLDTQKLHAFDLDVRDVASALRRENVEKPAGYLASHWVEMTVRTLGESRTPEDFAKIVIADRGDRLVRLSDVAVVEDGLTDRRAFARFNGIPNVGVGVMRAKGANVVGVCDAVKAKLPELRAMLPEGMEIGISVDYSMFIRKDVDELQFTLVLGIILTAAVAFMFLGALGPTLNICLSIPTSLVGTFFVMKLMGFTVNFMTLLALSLSVGVVVDDAILVLENIYRRCEHGEPPMQAAFEGAREISFAAIVATISICAIFLPVAFLEGAIGRMFFEFGITVSVAVLLSLVTSLTLTPMLCAYFLRVRQSPRPRPRAFRGPLGWLVTIPSQIYWVFDRFLVEPLLVRPVNWTMRLLTTIYGHLVHWALRLRWLVVVASLALIGLAGVFVTGAKIPLPTMLARWFKVDALTITPLGTELVPSEDQSRFVVRIICPVGSSIDHVDAMLQRCEGTLFGMPEVATFFSAVSTQPGQLVSEGILFCRLVDMEHRTKTQLDLIREVQQKLDQIPGMRAITMDLSVQGFTAKRGSPVNFAIQGPDWDQVGKYSTEIVQEMQRSGMLMGIDSDYRPGMPEVRVVPNRQRAAELGVPMSGLAYTINAMVGGVRSGRFTADGKRYDVRLRLLSDQRGNPEDIKNLYVRSDKNKLVPLADLVDLTEVATLPSIYRYNHQRKVELTANPAAGVSQGEAIAKSREIAEKILPPDYHIVQLGNAQAMQQTLHSLSFALGLGIIVAYMVLGVQFNSFLHPLTVLLALPFAVTGALATLWWWGNTLNLMSMIGLVLLMGLVKKNSIILVDYINQLRARGLDLETAVRRGCPIRLRPILMTSLATIAGAAPLAFGYGPGAETRAPLARGIIGGIVVSTCVTLIVVPVFYVLFDHASSGIRRVLFGRRDEMGPVAGEPLDTAPLLLSEPVEVTAS